MQVAADPEPPAGSEPGPSPSPEDGHNTYATLQRPPGSAQHSPGGDAHYATLGRYSAPGPPPGPTIPGVVPARQPLPPPPPPSQAAPESRHRRLSVGTDGRPELVSELH